MTCLDVIGVMDSQRNFMTHLISLHMSRFQLSKQNDRTNTKENDMNTQAEETEIDTTKVEKIESTHVSSSIESDSDPEAQFMICGLNACLMTLGW